MLSFDVHELFIRTGYVIVNQERMLIRYESVFLRGDDQSGTHNFFDFVLKFKLTGFEIGLGLNWRLDHIKSHLDDYLRNVDSVFRYLHCQLIQARKWTVQNQSHYFQWYKLSVYISLLMKQCIKLDCRNRAHRPAPDHEVWLFVSFIQVFD